MRVAHLGSEVLERGAQLGRFDAPVVVGVDLVEPRGEAWKISGHLLPREAGVVRVADALDMTKGRTRIPFEAGVVNIHSLSAASIEQVEILAGAEKPIHIHIRMNNSAGIFQLDELLKDKLDGSGLEPYVEVEAMIKGEAEKKLIQTFRI